MQFLLGLLTAVVFFSCLYTAFWIGQKQAKKPSAPVPMDKEEKKEIERYNKHFKALFNYDVDKARERKKVM